ncbi:dTDP-4-dehydrorhamnose reductase [Roseovarius sp. ZX-A-9]|uniref:dTDP-4-dehydrorhamnose reductase n=1 Tax=Roseovarius sp. ZX-A-9 TaxID=3014783 RepID=UPI00232ECD48|nr:dTDP-4-dehydrorhamnose reductase [Roseovarius sp. ZX-A-9]
MRLLVFGKTGQVAQELGRLGAGPHEITCLGRDEADFTNPLMCLAALKQHGPDAVINAAAYTRVDDAEEEEPLATQINADTPGVLATECAAMGIPFLQISTDYVFDGSGQMPFAPDHATAPLGAYGRSKQAGEAAVRAAGGNHVILRTSWVFSAHGNNFVKTMLRLGAERDRLTVVADQIGGPTPAAAIATACLHCAERLAAEPELSGTYHFTGRPDVSWAEFARAIFAIAGLTVEVADIPSADYPTPARRPANSRLDCSSLHAAFGIERPDWQRALELIITALRGATP